MPDPLPKIKYYVKCGELEKWVLAVDPTNAAFLAFCDAASDITLDPYFFYVSASYIPDIASAVSDSGEILISQKGLEVPVLSRPSSVALVKTDDILDMLDCE